MYKKKGLASKQIPSFFTHRSQDVWWIYCKPQGSIRLTSILCIHVYTTPIHTSIHLYTFIHTCTHMCMCTHTQQKQQQQPPPSPTVSLAQSWESTWRSTVADVSGAKFHASQVQLTCTQQNSPSGMAGFLPCPFLCICSQSPRHHP